MEYRRQCSVCGKIYCYSDSELSDNSLNSFNSAISAIGAVASLFGGTRFDTYALNRQSAYFSDKVTDFTQCPNCHSRSTFLISDTSSKSTIATNAHTQLPDKKIEEKRKLMSRKKSTSEKQARIKLYWSKNLPRLKKLVNEKLEAQKKLETQGELSAEEKKQLQDLIRAIDIELTKDR